MKRYLPLAILLLAVAWVASTLLPPRNPTAYNLVGFGRLPILLNGRIKPFDTVARNSLLVLQGKQSVLTPAGDALDSFALMRASLFQPEKTATDYVLNPDTWLLDVLYRPDVADTYQVFRIDNPDVLALFGLKDDDGQGKVRFSFKQLSAHLADLDSQAKLADPVDAQTRTSFQRAVVQLRDNVVLYMGLKHSLQLPDSPDFFKEILQFQDDLPKGIDAVRAKQAGQAYDAAAYQRIIDAGTRFAALNDYGSLLPIPPAPGNPDNTAWQKTGQALLETFSTGSLNPNVLVYAALGHAWNQHQPDVFNKLIGLYRGELAHRFSSDLRKTDAETYFNHAQPFYTSMVLYVAVFLLAILSWLKWPDALSRAAFYLMSLAWLLATAGILTRMWLEGRPPVTNLYSSAVFIGWGSVLLCLVLEKLYKNGIGCVAGAGIGFSTLLIAHHLALSGDTLEMMRAVLDSNFWLSTHVVTVTTGYASTFLAGFLAIIYILRGLFTRTLDKATADSLTRMVYGIVCFATLFSLVGTVLGGIWADQSWGRFWGWDPKENGALIIVIWNAIILHCRWGGMVRARGLMALAVFGNIVTSWSWFGTNMLGIGLHSYGFMESEFWWLIGFVISQLIIIALALIPLDQWRSFGPARAPVLSRSGN